MLKVLLGLSCVLLFSLECEGRKRLPTPFRFRDPVTQIHSSRYDSHRRTRSDLSPSYQELYFTQVLDHFTFPTADISNEYQERYLISYDYWGGEGSFLSLLETFYRRFCRFSHLFLCGK